jgi:RNA polymerase sigma-70 factor (ECF subfamily)
VTSTNPTPLPTDASLVDRIRAGDASGLEALFHLYYDPLCRFAEAYVRSRAEAEDLVQGMFVHLWEQRERWALRGSVRAYLYTAVRNAALNVLKHRLVERRALTDDDSIPRIGMAQSAPSPHDDAVGHELEEAIGRAIDGLPDRYRLVVTLRAQHHLSIPEIARILDLPVKTAETRAARAIQALRAALEHFLK